MIDNIITLVHENMLLSIVFLALVILYILFELSQMRFKSDGISPQKAIFMLNRERAVFLDIRDKESYQKGHIVDAISSDIKALKESTQFLQKYKKRPIIVYCDKGISAKEAVLVLKKDGFEHVYNLNGGLGGWKEEKLPVHTKAAKKLS